MSHVQNFDRVEAGRMLTHYTRELSREGRVVSYGASEVDTSRSYLNYRLDSKNEHPRTTLQRRLSEVRVMKRENVNVLSDWVVTMPTDGSVAPAEERRFFEATYACLKRVYGEENIVGAFVHKDEVTPHMHFAFVPIVVDKGKKHNGELKVCANELLNRTHLWQMHRTLQKEVSDALGHRVSILLEDTEKNGKTSRVHIDDLAEFKKARDEAKAKIETPTVALTATSRRESAVKAADKLINTAARVAVTQKKLEATQRQVAALQEKMREAKKEISLLRKLRAGIKKVKREAPKLFEKFQSVMTSESIEEKRALDEAAGKKLDENMSAISRDLRRQKMRRDVLLSEMPGLSLIVKRFGWSDKTEEFIKKYQQQKATDADFNDSINIEQENVNGRDRRTGISRRRMR